MTATFTHLFSPIVLGPLELKNRLFNPLRRTSLGQSGQVGDDLIACHEARARGGVGVIGDAAQPRTVEEAVLEGFEAALEI